MQKYNYDLIVIGGGSAGLVSAYYARGLGKKVLIVSDGKPASKFRHDIPLKMFSDAARGCALNDRYDHRAVLEKIRAMVKMVSAHTSADQIRTSGIEVAGGYGKFSDPHTITVGKKTFTAGIIIISAGSSAIIPQIEGLEGNFIEPAKFLSLDELPDKVAILGAGPAGCQFARALAYAGKRVVLIEEQDHILPREDREIAAKLAEIYTAEKLHLLTGAKVSSIHTVNGKKVLTCHASGKKHTISVNAILLCTGRKPALEKLNLAAAQLDTPEVDRSLRSKVPHIFLAGDAAGPWYLTSLAEERGACAAANAFASVKSYPRYEHTLWHSFTSPDIARSGLTEEEAAARYGKRSIRVYRFPFAYSMGAQVESRSNGFAKFICKSNGRILGAHILDQDAGSLILPVHTARALNVPFSKLSAIPHHFPGISDIYKQPARRCYVDTLNRNPLVAFLQVLLPHKR